MQECNCTVRLSGSLLHTVPMTGVTPPEILLLNRIHGEGSVVDIRPTKVIKRPHDREWARLAEKYDRASTFTAAPGDEQEPLMAKMFPGAMRKLPTTLKEIGLGHLMSSASIKAAEEAAASAPALPDEDLNIGTDDDGTDDDNGGED